MREDKINIINIATPFGYSFLDYPDNESMCISIYMYGCHGKCKECHNPELQSFHSGCGDGRQEYTVDQLFEAVMRATIKSMSNKVCIMGGEPLHEWNIDSTKELISKLDTAGVDVCLYTGYDIDYVRNNNVSGFRYVKVGMYEPDNRVEAVKTDDYVQLSSTNQEIYNEQYKKLTENGRYHFSRREEASLR